MKASVAVAGPVSWRDYVELTKPRLSSLVVVTTAAGYWMALQGPGSAGLFIAAAVGTALVAGGANALNEWMEWKYDAVMERTKNRPIPSGRVTPPDAFLFGCAITVLGLVLLASRVNTLSMALAALSAASYLALYTPLKRVTALCTLAGAVPGAIPPMIGWAAVRNSLSLEAWALFLLLFVWQLPHFLALAWIFREDYARAGYRMLSVTEPRGYAIARQAFFYGLVLVPISLFPARISLAGPLYFFAALILSLGFLVMAIRAGLVRSVKNAQLLFRSSILYLPLLLGVLMWDKAPHLMMRKAPGQVSSQAVSVLPDDGPLPAFSLTDHHGRRFNRDSIQGFVWVFDFIFTRCSGQCPIMTQCMAGLSKQFKELASVRFASISVDPSYDDPKRLSEYAAQMNAKDNQWLFLTGSEESVFALSRDGFHLGVGKEGSVEEPITHSVRLALVDQQGHIRGYYDATNASAMRRLNQDIRLLAGK